MKGIKKGAILNCQIQDIIFPATGVADIQGQEIRIKNTLPGQEVKVRIKKKRKEYYEGILMETISTSPEETVTTCRHYPACGGCNQQSIPYNIQLKYKEKQVKRLFKQNGFHDFDFLGINPSPEIYEYRNKMEFTFGDLARDGILQLGLHPRNKRFDIVTVDDCRLVDNDFRQILVTVLNYARDNQLSKYHFIKKEGFLRHLVIRKGLNTGEILVNLITTSQYEHDFSRLLDMLQGIKYKGRLVGVLHTINNDYADAVKCDYLLTLTGRSYYYEELLGLTFKITPFSFFQPNTSGAEVLYQTVLKFLGDGQKKLVYDLYCGTGTISQIVAQKAKEVIGIELVKEAVEIARENARLNGFDNCHFLTGDVLEIIDELHDKPEVIIIDPPRPGIHPQALKKLLKFNSPEVIYVSCNPRTLVRDLKEFSDNGYKIIQVQCVDMFPHTPHIETVVQLMK